MFTTNDSNHLMVLLKKHSGRHSLARILIGHYNNARSHRAVSTAPNILPETLLREQDQTDAVISHSSLGMTPNFLAGVIGFMKPCDNNLKKTLHLTDEMIELANIGDAEREDTGCGILYGIMRDSAYKIQKLAETEREKHIKKGWWHQNRKP